LGSGSEDDAREGAMDKTVGVALSGGAARTIAHVGVLKVLEEEGIRIGAISGTSGGSVVAALYAAGLPIDDLVQLSLKLSWRHLLKVSVASLGLLSTDAIGKFMETWIGNPDFKDLRIPCAIVATELSTFRAKVFLQGPVLPAVEASCAIPHVYRPVKLDRGVYMDGGIVNFLPAESLPYLGADVTVGVSTMRGRPRGVQPKHLVHLMALFSRFVQYNNYVRSRERVDVLIHPPLHRFPVYKLHNAPAILEEGERAARNALPQLRRFLEGKVKPIELVDDPADSIRNSLKESPEDFPENSNDSKDSRQSKDSSDSRHSKDEPKV
jgi:NTE family protein